VVNREKAHVTDYAYSDALKAKGGTWSYDSLNQFLYQAKVYIPGTKMNFAGFKTAQERANIVAYMRTLSDSPAPLPESAK
jgi:cytochrome c